MYAGRDALAVSSGADGGLDMNIDKRQLVSLLDDIRERSAQDLKDCIEIGAGNSHGAGVYTGIIEAVDEVREFLNRESLLQQLIATETARRLIVAYLSQLNDDSEATNIIARLGWRNDALVEERIVKAIAEASKQ